MYPIVHQPFHNEAFWEAMWAPYPEEDYQFVLAQIHPEDTVLEIGAGDMRLATRIARVARCVYAIEKNVHLTPPPAARQDLPSNLVVIQGDARSFPFPPNITVAVLMMRHCTHFAHYLNKLRKTSCNRLITNARWRTGVETIWLHDTRKHYDDFQIGWYACWCGQTGFKAGSVDLITPEIEQMVHETATCPHCKPQRS